MKNTRYNISRTLKKAVRTKINGLKKTAKTAILNILKFQRFQRLKNKTNTKTTQKRPPKCYEGLNCVYLVERR